MQYIIQGAAKNTGVYTSVCLCVCRMVRPLCT